MRPYKSKSGKDSGVIAYRISKDNIAVLFAGGERYTYSYTSAGQDAVEEMKALAERQKGLSTYISQHQPGYE